MDNLQTVASPPAPAPPIETPALNGQAAPPLPPLPVLAGQIVEFTPAGAPDGRVYKFRVPSLGDRASYQRHLAVICGEYPSDTLLIAALRRAYNEIADDDERGEILEFLAAIRPVYLGLEPSEGRDDDLARLSQLRLRAQRGSRDFAELCASRIYFITMTPLIALQHFLAGWDNGPCEFARTKAFASDASLAAIPTAERQQLGNFALELTTATERLAKN